MRRVRLRRGLPAINVPNMPSQEAWKKSYCQKFKTTDFPYFSTFTNKIYHSSEELFNEIDRSLTDPGPATREWAAAVLNWFGLPIE